MAWTDIQGQPLAVRILATHCRRGRVAPAYLFAGPDGVGKRLVARELAKALNCQRALAGEPEHAPCDACDACRRIVRGQHPDVHQLAPEGDSASIRIDAVRALLGRVGLRPFMANIQVAILDCADRLTDEAGNSLLKTLEEPPTWTRFVLLTSQPSRCLPTICSRCQPIRFQRLPLDVLEALLTRQGLDAAAVSSISRVAQGSLSRAAELAQARDDHAATVEQLSGDDAQLWAQWTGPTDRDALGRWLRGSIGWLRDVMVAAAGEDDAIERATAAEAIRRQARRAGPRACARTAMRLVALQESLEQMANPRLVAALLREEWLAFTRKTERTA